MSVFTGLTLQNYPFIDPRPQIGRVALTEISHQDRINIFSANARRLVFDL